jgi:predicted nucleic acid-binding protein
MAKRYLLDTNVIIDYSSNKLTSKGQTWIENIIDSDSKISIITKIELLGFSIVPKEIEIFTENVEIIGLEQNIVNETIHLRKKYRCKLPDAIIAATAITNNYILISRNISDFKKITELQTINPYDL